MRRSGNRPIAVVAAALAAVALAGPVTVQARAVPPSAADVARAWVRDWSRGEETAVCSRVARPLLQQLALASGTSACSGAVASALRAGAARWSGASIVTMRAVLVTDTLAEVRFSLRHSLRVQSPTSPDRPLDGTVPDRIYLTRPDARSGAPWRVASLGTLPFIASGTSEVAFDPVTLDPPGVSARLHEPVTPGRLSPACSGAGTTVTDPAGDARIERPPPRAAGQLLPHHPRGDEFGTILSRRPFAFTGPRIARPELDLRALTMHREADGRVCLEVRFARAPRPDSRLLVRWFEPVPGSDSEGASGSVELRFDGRGGLHFWFDRLARSIADPDLAPRFAARVPQVGRSGAVLSIRLSASDLSGPERFRIALRTASSRAADPAGVAAVPAGDTIGAEATGVQWPDGGVGPLFDPGTGPA